MYIEKEKTKKSTISKNSKIQSQNFVIQRAYATVDPQNGPIELTWSDTFRAYRSMTNNAQLIGGDVQDNGIGYTGILNKGSWEGLAKSSIDYHRAHAYAKSFGGAGSEANVGWWPSENEKTWTKKEDQVRGGGQDELPAWKPGDGEVGNYTIDRVNLPNTDVKKVFRDKLIQAAVWGTSVSRPAWVRTALNFKGNDKYNLEDVKAARGAAETNANVQVGTWVDNTFRNTNTHFIKKMVMNYTITTGGTGPGNSRKNFSHTEDVKDGRNKAISVPLANFGLTGNDQSIWQQMVGNRGVFGNAGGVLSSLHRQVTSPNVQHGAPNLELGPKNDGWGF